MKIKKLHISNFKSIKDLELINPNPFSVFAGPNGAGKSNIFEALEFGFAILQTRGYIVQRTFGGIAGILNFNSEELTQSIKITGDTEDILDVTFNYGDKKVLENLNIEHRSIIDESQAQNKPDEGYKSFSHVFLNNRAIKKFNIDDDSLLNLDGSNLEKVLNRIFKDETKREEVIEWLQVLVPEFKDIKIDTSSLSGDVNYVIYEKHCNKPFPKHLISDGTKNILALLTAVYQSDEPQFLCIEEPENGLHPYVIESLVGFFRNACKEKGHYIWLNTHSQTLVRQLTVDEIIVVDKKEGATRVRQFQERNLHGLPMDEAWLTNALGGGLP